MADFLAMNGDELEVEEQGETVYIAVCGEYGAQHAIATPRQAMEFAQGIILAATAADERTREQGHPTTLPISKQRTVVRRKLLLAVTKLLNPDTTEARRRG